jgi:hypothetical protein
MKRLLIFFAAAIVSLSLCAHPNAPQAALPACKTIQSAAFPGACAVPQRRRQDFYRLKCKRFVRNRSGARRAGNAPAVTAFCALGKRQIPLRGREAPADPKGTIPAQN